MNKKFGFGSKRRSSNNIVPTPNASSTSIAPSHSPPPAPAPLGVINPSPPPHPQPPPAGNASTVSLPMNPNQLGRPPSYSYSTGPPGPLGPNGQPMGRSPSPLPPPGHGMAHPPPPTQVMNGPPPLNTGAGQGYPPPGGLGGMGAPPPAAGGPPQYGGGYGAPGGPPPAVPGGQYGPRPNAVEVEGAGRSKAQLIVGIDFVGGPADWSLGGRIIVLIPSTTGHHLFRRRLCFCDQ